MSYTKQTILYISIGLNIILLIIFAVVVYNWLNTNTSVLNTGLSSDELAQNNLNQANGPPYELKETELSGYKLNLPEGFNISEYATGIGSARFFSIGDDGTLYVGTKDNDKVYAVSDSDGDGRAETINVLDSGLDVPHSTYFYQGDLYVAEQTKVSLYRGVNKDGSYDSKEVIIDNSPTGNRLTGGGHKTRTVMVGPDNKLYLSIGSSCNVCEESDERRATMMRFELDGSNPEIIASGLRNSVGYDFDENGVIWAADMGRDQIGDDIPPEEINVIEVGADYGWPYCYGAGYFNPEYPDKAEFCRNETEFPILNMQAHSAPLGVSFLNQATKDTWPEAMKDGLLVALHGSWNRTVPTGYKVIWIERDGDQLKQYNFISGWLDESAEAWGRPAGLGFDSSGNLYLSDDKRGVIYKISYTN